MGKWITAAVLVSLACGVGFAQEPKKGDQNKQGQGDTQKDKDRPSGDQKGAAEGAKQFLKQHDKNNDGNLTRDELPAAMREGFADVDANGDGKISADEMRKHVESMVLVPIPVPVPVEVVSLYMVEAATDAPSRTELQDIYDTLRKADANNDGKLSEEEMKSARENAIQQRVDSIFKRCDTNNDGKISKEECPEQMRGMFKRADKDNDGSVSKQDLKECCTKAAEQAGKSDTAGKSEPKK